MGLKRCISDNCKNFAKNGRCCNTCTSRRYRAKYPLKYVFDTLKTNAKRRGKEFTITLNYFSEIVSQKEGYLEHKGRENGALQVDRIDNELGYIEGNIRIITAEENRAAYYEFMKQKSLHHEEGDIYVGDLSVPMPF